LPIPIRNPDPNLSDPTESLEFLELLERISMQLSLNHWHAQLRTIAQSHTGEDGAHDLAHLDRVWKLARSILDAHPEADQLVVLAACYLHDVVNLPKNHPNRTRASVLAAQLACAKLKDAGFPDEKLASVADAIESHSFSAGIAPKTIEAKIVQDADRLDALGAIGLARLFYTAGRMGSALAHPTDPLANERPLDDKRFALDHIEVKLATLPATMQTEQGRQFADARLATLYAFREQFATEWL
jgi:uncharacterized protein